MKSIHPIGDRVVVDPIVKEADRVGKILLPEYLKKTAATGRVVEVGKRYDEKTHEPIPNVVSPGDIVILPQDGKLGDVDVTGDGGEERKFWIFRESDLVAVVED